MRWVTSITEQDIEEGMTEAGGFDQETLAAWGVPWPPPKGWKNVLLGKQPRPTTWPRPGA